MTVNSCSWHLFCDYCLTFFLLGWFMILCLLRSWNALWYTWKLHELRLLLSVPFWCYMSRSCGTDALYCRGSVGKQFYRQGGNSWMVMTNTEFTVTVNQCSSARANKSSRKRGVFFTFLSLWKGNLLQTTVDFAPSGDNSLSWEFVLVKEGRRWDGCRNSSYNSPPPPLLCASLGISHRIPQILMTPVKMNITCHQIPCCMI